jgi:hypothetical protein
MKAVARRGDALALKICKELKKNFLSYLFKEVELNGIRSLKITKIFKIHQKLKEILNVLVINGSQINLDHVRFSYCLRRFFLTKR